MIRRLAHKVALCPSRRGQTQFSFITRTDSVNVERPEVVARNDYAACSGSLYSVFGVNRGPNLPASGQMPDPLKFTGYDVHTVGQSVYNSAGAEIPRGNGVVLAMSETRIAQITDGTTSTILFGEKHIQVADYEASTTAANNQGWDLGIDIDVNRWTMIPPLSDGNTTDYVGDSGLPPIWQRL